MWKAELNREMFMCKFCSEMGDSLKAIRNHVEWEHMGGTEFPCAYCNKVMRTKGSYNNHISLKHREQHAKARKTEKTQMGSPGAGSGGAVSPDVALLQPSCSLTID